MNIRRRPALLVWITVLAGLAVFSAVRLASLSTAGGLQPWSDLGLIAWTVVPMVLTYLGATSIGLLLVRDGVTRWWWLPATLFVLFDLPFEGWIGSWNVVSTGVGTLAGSGLDLLAMLAPAAVLARLTSRPRVELTSDRIGPSIAVVSSSVLIAMLIGIEGADASTAALAVIAFGICSQSWSWKRAAAFLAIALSLGAALPGSLAISLSQGSLSGAAAIDDSYVDLLIALMAFSIAPLSSVWARLFGRRSPSVVAATHGS